MIAILAQSSLLDAVGRLHPLTVHVPIVLFILSPVLELFRRHHGVPRPLNLGLIILGVATISAVLAAASGLAGVQSREVLNSTLEWHRWTAYASVAVGVLTLAQGFWAIGRPSTRALGLYRSGLLIGAALMIVVTIFGDAVVRGTESLPAALRKIMGGG